MHMYQKRNKPRGILIFSVDIYQVVVLNIDGLDYLDLSNVLLNTPFPVLFYQIILDYFIHCSLLSLRTFKKYMYIFVNLYLI